MNTFDFWGAKFSTENLTERDFESTDAKLWMADAFAEIERHDLSVSSVQEVGGVVTIFSELAPFRTYRTRFCLECKGFGTHDAECQMAEVEYVMET